MVRHGQTIKNEIGIIHNHPDQSPLNEEGRQWSLLAARALARLSVSLLFSSTEERARQTADIISQEIRLPVSFSDKLVERNWGIYEGRPWDEVHRLLKGMTVNQRYNYLPPGGESWRQMAERAGGFLAEICKRNDGATIVAITHGGVIRAMIPYLSGLPREESFKYNLKHLSFTIFNFEKDHFTLKEANRVEHLRPLINGNN